jgi:hypothetical protein
VSAEVELRSYDSPSIERDASAGKGHNKVPKWKSKGIESRKSLALQLEGFWKFRSKSCGAGQALCKTLSTEARKVRWMAPSMISMVAAVMGVIARLPAATKTAPRAQAIGGISAHNRFSRHTRERLCSGCGATIIATHVELRG